MTVSVRIAQSDEELLEAARIDLTAFGLPFARTAEAMAALERSLTWRRTTTTYLAEFDGEPVGTARVYDFGLSLPGGAVVAVSGIGDLGVLPGFRGRGVFRALLERMLRDGTRRGHVAAVLYASEATIYGAFGFAPAARSKRVRVPVARARFRPDVQVAPGRTQVLDPEHWMDVLPDVYERALTRRAGEVTRSPELWTKVLSGSIGGDGHMGGDGAFVMVHRDPTGSPDAYARYSIEESWQPVGPQHSMEVHEVVAVDAPAELALWGSLLSLGLVQNIECWLPTDSPLFSALDDRWALGTTGEIDTLWVRVLDVRRAIAARRYRTPGALVLEVTDGASDGSSLGLRVSVTDRGGTCEVDEASGAAEMCCSLEELGGVWLGGGSFTTLAASGRILERRDGTAAVADALFGWSPLPGVTHDF